jgi:hypothetical protein
VPEPSQIQLETEHDPTPLVRGVHADLARRLTDPGFAELTTELAGTVGIRAAATPEAVTATIAAGRVSLARGLSDEAQVVATLEAGDGRAQIAPQAQADHPSLAAWLDALLAPSGDWGGAAERFWAALEGLPGAPDALLVVELESGERRRFGADGRAYEIHGRAADLVALLEGRAPLIDLAFERRILIRGSFPEISVLSAAAFAVRTGDTGGHG